MSNTNSDSALTSAEYARETGLSLGYVYTQLWTGRLPATKVRGVWQIAASEAKRRLRLKSISESELPKTGLSAAGNGIREQVPNPRPRTIWG